MNCLDFHRQCLTDPNCRDQAYTHHREHCERCAEHYRQAMQQEQHLRAAMQINVPANLASEIILQQSIQRPETNWYRRVLPIAASLVLALIVTLSIHWQSPDSRLQESLLSYVNTPQDISISAGQRFQADAIDAVLNPLGLALKTGFGPVSHAKPCVILGKKAAHLVVPDKSGNIDLIYMPEQTITQRHSVNQSGKTLVLIPCPRGSLAIYGNNAQQIAQVEKRFDESRVWL